jgi:hypothetical protein
MGGEHISQEVKDLFEEKWLVIKNERPDKDPKASEVLKDVKLQLIKDKKSNMTLPKLRASQIICSKIKSRHKSRSEPEKALDEEWTMAKMKVLKESELPAYSLPAIVNVWRYAANANEKFTIRQAKWVSRLHSMPSLDNITLLWFWSNQYSYLEQLSSIRENFDTYYADAALFIGKWEWDIETLDRTGFREESTGYSPERLLPPKKDGEFILELLHGLQHHYRLNFEDKYNERNRELYDLVEKLPSLKSLGFLEETKFVYLRWFTSYIIKGPKWNDLSPEDALIVIVKLRELILIEQDYRQSDKFKENPADVLRMSLRPFSSGMRELLEQVGYEFGERSESPRHTQIEEYLKQIRGKTLYPKMKEEEE